MNKKWVLGIGYQVSGAMVSFRCKPESPDKCSEAWDPDFRQDDSSGPIPETRYPKPETLYNYP
ncbi:MAG TPA: hypothetical protein DC042_12950 [Bacteroidales bacterium]|nr:hypothetical protein [Bacteroidales bacterium]